MFTFKKLTLFSDGSVFVSIAMSSRLSSVLSTDLALALFLPFLSFPLSAFPSDKVTSELAAADFRNPWYFANDE